MKIDKKRVLLQIWSKFGNPVTRSVLIALTLYNTSFSLINTGLPLYSEFDNLGKKIT